MNRFIDFSKLSLTVGFILKPYFNRLKRGEGGLVVFNLLTATFASKNLEVIVIETALSFLVMCALYGYNDYRDRVNDMNNEKKERVFSLNIIQNPKLFMAVNITLTCATLVYAAFFGSYVKVILIGGVYLVNYLYSIRLKTIPFVDIIIVMLWGGLYAMIVGRFYWQLMCIAGIMTGIAHLFQMITDKIPDGMNKVTTTIVAKPYMANYLLLALCLALGIFMYQSLGIWWAASCLLPFAIYFLSKRVTPSWHVSRFYFAVCWLQLLIVFYGGF